MLLVETEGSYTIQQNYTNMDIHAGQSYSFLVTMDQNASSDYYIAASARFVNESIRDVATGVAILHYSNSQGPASGPLPDGPDERDTYFSINQAKSIRYPGDLHVEVCYCLPVMCVLVVCLKFSFNLVSLDERIFFIYIYISGSANFSHISW